MAKAAVLFDYFLLNNIQPRSRQFRFSAFNNKLEYTFVTKLRIRFLIYTFESISDSLRKTKQQPLILLILFCNLISVVM